MMNTMISKIKWFFLNGCTCNPNETTILKEKANHNCELFKTVHRQNKYQSQNVLNQIKKLDKKITKEIHVNHT